MYLSDSTHVTNVTRKGINITETYQDVCPVVSPIRKVVSSNIHPEKNLDHAVYSHLVMYGKIVKPLVRISAGFPAPFQHVLTFRRQCGLILDQETDHMDESFVIEYCCRIHRVFMSTDGMSVLHAEDGNTL